MSASRLGSILSSAAVVVVASWVVAAPPASATAPPPASACVVTANTFVNTTDVVIPTLGPDTVTSTITVAGQPAYLTDVDVLTSITHGFARDLDITVESAFGTVVTLTTDNGGPADDVFNGTIWDDDADPGGALPYVIHDGLATDHGYVSNVVASPLVPEEALSAFVGEDPNGIWTLTVHDDANGVGLGGLIDTWALALSSQPFPPATTTRTVANATPVAFPASPVLITSDIVVSGAGPYLQDVDARTFLRQGFSQKVAMTVTSPAGTVVTLTTGNGDDLDDIFNGTLWNDDANPGGQVPYTDKGGLVTDARFQNGVAAPNLVPEEALGAFIGENPNGTWTLTVATTAGASGSLDRWSLALRTGDCRPRPDARVRRLPSGPTVGNGIYNTTGARQTATGSAPRGQSVSYALSVQNDGRAPATFRLKGGGSTNAFTVVYRDPANMVVTGDVVAGTYESPPLGAGGTHTLRAVVTIRNNAPANASLARTLTATSTTDGTRKDVVKFVTRRT